jgi:hypothetical protein
MLLWHSFILYTIFCHYFVRRAPPLLFCRVQPLSTNVAALPRRLDLPKLAVSEEVRSYKYPFVNLYCRVLE